MSKLYHRLILVLLSSLVVNFSSRRVFKRIFKKIPSKRAKTLVSVAQNAATALVLTLAAFMILSELGINITPLLTSAGIIGFAVSFGSQTLIKDLIAGLFLLAEDIIREGETVQVAGVKGKVKSIKIRTVILEDEKGTLHTIPNGTIKTVSNFSRQT